MGSLKTDPMPKGKEREKGNDVGRSRLRPAVTSVFRTVSRGFVCLAGRNGYDFPVRLSWDYMPRVILG